MRCVILAAAGPLLEGRRPAARVLARQADGVQRRVERASLVRIELVVSRLEGRGQAVDDRRRRPQLVGGERAQVLLRRAQALLGLPDQFPQLQGSRARSVSR